LFAMFYSPQAREMPPSPLSSRPLSAAHRAPHTNPAVFAGPPQGRAGPPQHPEPDVQGQLLSHAQALAALPSSHRSAITPRFVRLFKAAAATDIDTALILCIMFKIPWTSATRPM